MKYEFISIIRFIKDVWNDLSDLNILSEITLYEEHANDQLLNRDDEACKSWRKVRCERKADVVALCGNARIVKSARSGL